MAPGYSVVPFSTLDPVDDSIDLGRDMLTEGFHHPALLVSKVMPLRNCCGGVPSIFQSHRLNSAILFGLGTFL